MRIPFISMFITSPFSGLAEHAEKVKECAWIFQHAIECLLVQKCDSFEELRKEVARIESQADAIKRRIRGHIPKGAILQVDKFTLFRYLGEQDSVLDALEDALNWISFRIEPGVPRELEKEFLLLVDAVIDPVDELSMMVAEARKYFSNYSENQRMVVKKIVRTLREQEHTADEAEDQLKLRIFQVETDPITVFHMIRLAEIIGSIADHAQNAGDMMRAMIAR
ncbi:MAG: TIGR00153 family protein [Desulfobacterales bacterium]